MRTELPKNWCIKVTSENRDKINKYRKENNFENFQDNIGSHYDYVYLYNKEGHKNLIGDGGLNGEEITFEEFERLVLKKDNKKYTIEDVKTNPKLLVYIPTQEEYDRLDLDFFRINSNKGYKGPYCYSYCHAAYSSSSSIDDIGNFDKDCLIVESKDVITDSCLKKEELQFKAEFVAKGKDCYSNIEDECKVITREAFDYIKKSIEYPLTFDEVFTKPKQELQFQEPCIIKRKKKRK